MQTYGITKSATGIAGFDQITRGGLPRDRTTMVMGGPGSGKTTFALQFLVNGARETGEPGIFVAFEENSRQILQNAATYGWDLPALERNQLFFLDARIMTDALHSGQFDLSGMLAALKAKASAMGAKRIVFDSVDVMLTLLNDPAAERNELYRLREWLSDSGMTGILTAKAESCEALRPVRYEFLQFMADCVVLLHHRLNERMSTRGVRILKYRGSGFAASEFPLALTDRGLEVGNHGPVEMDYAVSEERVGTGVERLDAMLDGGYYRGSSVLISGAPGTAKSTLSAAFLSAACERGEKALYVSFDESASQIARNMRSVGTDLDRHIKTGLLRMHSARSEAATAEEHLVRLRDMIREFRPACVVIDPLSALARPGGEAIAMDVNVRLLDALKSMGITVICTSLVDTADQLAETTAAGISTIADTWIQLSYVVRAGERNRALSVIKSRGMRHSNQVRELVLSSAGVTLTDVYTAGGEVLMGTARWEKEQLDAAEREARSVEVARKQRELEATKAELLYQMQKLQEQLEASDREMEHLEAESQQARRHAEEFVERLQSLRGADRTGGGSGR